MSFGFSIGDFIAVLQLANEIRKEFVGAPGQFQAISDEYELLEPTVDSSIRLTAATGVG